MVTNIIITIDTEASPKTTCWRESELADEFRWDIFGETPHGGYGIPYQMDLLDAYGLRAVFFVESLFACEVGARRLRELVELIQGRGHEVQLHLHTEWLWRMRASILPGRTGKNLKD